MSQITEIRIDDRPADIHAAKALADSYAAHILGADKECLSWYDSQTGQECPKNTNLCCCGEDLGYAEYAINRGATLKLVSGDGRFTFFYCIPAVA